MENVENVENLWKPSTGADTGATVSTNRRRFQQKAVETVDTRYLPWLQGNSPTLVTDDEGFHVFHRPYYY